MDHTQRPSYMAYLPAKVRYDGSLSSSAKLIYAEITALADATGCCWATNSYLANLFGINRKLWVDTPPPKNEEENDLNKLNVIPPKAP